MNRLVSLCVAGLLLAPAGAALAQDSQPAQPGAEPAAGKASEAQRVFDELHQTLATKHLKLTVAAEVNMSMGERKRSEKADVTGDLSGDGFWLRDSRGKQEIKSDGVKLWGKSQNSADPIVLKAGPELRKRMARLLVAGGVMMALEKTGQLAETGGKVGTYETKVSELAVAEVEEQGQELKQLSFVLTDRGRPTRIKVWIGKDGLPRRRTAEMGERGITVTISETYTIKQAETPAETFKIEAPLTAD